jgi:hypothetical protein
MLHATAESLWVILPGEAKPGDIAGVNVFERRVILLVRTAASEEPVMGFSLGIGDPCGVDPASPPVSGRIT